MKAITPLILIVYIFCSSCSSGDKPASRSDTTPDSALAEKQKPARVYLWPYLKGDKWGYADSNATIVIQPKYDDAYWMNDGFAIVKNGDSCAIIDSLGHEVTPFRYEYISNFKGKIAVFGRHGKYGIITAQGKEIVPAEYAEAECFENGIAVLADLQKQFSCFNSNGTLLFSGYKSIKPNIYQPYFMVENKDGRYGIVDQNDSTVIPFDYDWVSSYNGWKKDYVVVTKGEKYGMIDMHNKVILPFDFESLNYFEDKDLVVMAKNGKYGVCDLTGKTILAMKYDPFLNIINDNAFLVSINDKYGIVDSAGNEIIPLVYEYMTYQNGDLFSARGKTPPGKDFWTGFINIKGDTVVPFGDYWSLYFQEGLACASAYVTGKKGRKERLYGFINRNGEVVVPYKYKIVHDFEHGVALALSNDSLVCVTRTGKEFREK